MKSKRIFFTLAMALIVCVSAWAASVRVTGTNVRLRLSPSLNGRIYSTATGVPIYPAKGQILQWTGNATNGFYQVTYNGGTLWIHSDYAVPVNNTVQQQQRPTIPASVIVTGNNVLLRVGPGKNYAPLTYTNGTNFHLNKGNILRCVGINGDWWRVIYNGNYYYVSRQYTRPY